MNRAFFNMMKLWDCLTEQGRERLAEIYKQLTGKEWTSPKMSGVPDIESLKEISKIAKEPPNYVINKQGREG